MQKHEDTVQNLNGNVMVGATIQVMVAFTTTPATIFSDPAGQVPIDLLLTDNLGQFGFYAPNGRYDIFAIINGNRVAHDSDVLMYDPEDDERVTSGGGSGGGTGTGGGTGSGGIGTGLTPEVELPVVNGTVQPDYTLGNNFHVLLTANTRFLNPISYPEGVDITISVEQDASGNHIASFDTEYAMPDAQPIVLAPNGGAINCLRMHRTKQAMWLTESTPDKSIPTGYSLVTAIARIGSVEYFAMGVPLGSTVPGAMPAVKNGETIVVLRNGRGPEATGTITGKAGETYAIVGKPIGFDTDPDRRPFLTLLPDTRPSYDKAVLNFEGAGAAIVRDIRITGARNDYSDARGICNNDLGISLLVENVEITDCCMGIENANTNTVGDVVMNDCLIDKCGIGGPTPDPTHGYTTVGFTHSTYFGYNHSTITINRSTFTNSVDGDNIKSRSAKIILNQVLCSGATNGRELEIPNGGWVEATNCIFWKSNTTGGTGNLALVGGNNGADNTVEGLDTTRPRKYKFTNCRFRNDRQGLGDMTFIANLDSEVALEFIDCEFIGDQCKTIQTTPTDGANEIWTGCVTVNGIRYKPSVPPVFTLTGGPIGPILPVGYQPIPMTPLTV